MVQFAQSWLLRLQSVLRLLGAVAVQRTGGCRLGLAKAATPRRGSCRLGAFASLVDDRLRIILDSKGKPGNSALEGYRIQQPRCRARQGRSTWRGDPPIPGGP